jgi:hypothetical protein
LLEAVPAAITNWPAVHVDHEAQLGAFIVVLYVPEPHAMHIWSCIVVPGVMTN